MVRGEAHFMITVVFRCRAVASQIRNGWPGRLTAPPAGHRVGHPAL